jgi:hypothetical protein
VFIQIRKIFIFTWIDLKKLYLDRNFDFRDINFIDYIHIMTLTLTKSLTKEQSTMHNAVSDSFRSYQHWLLNGATYVIIKRGLLQSTSKHCLTFWTHFS